MERKMIYLDDAIDAYGDWYVEEGTEEGFIGTVKQLLEGLPSAQPEPCEFCKHNDTSDDVACLRCTAERRTDG